MIFTLEVYLASLKDGCWFGFTDNHNKTYENLFIRDGSEKPTEQECTDGVKAMQAEYDARQYQRDRVSAYPSIPDQLDKIYHSGIDEWKKDIKAVKDKFPKPE